MDKINQDEIPIIESEEDGYWEIYPDHKIWHDYKDMEFKDYKKSEEKYGLGSDWLNLEDGDNKVRIVSNFIDYGSHYNQQTKKSVICVGKESCEMCQQGDKPRVQYLGWVIDRKDKKLKLLRIGHQIFKQIGDYAMNEEYAFTGIPDYDITINKTGQGLGTDYTVIPSRKNTELTEKEKKEIEEKMKDPQEIIDSMKAKISKGEDQGGDTEEIEEGEKEIDTNDIPF